MRPHSLAMPNADAQVLLARNPHAARPSPDRPSADHRAAPSTPVPPLSFEEPHRTLDVGHSRLATWSFGRGPDLVFVHGWPLSAATFRHVARDLASSYTCHLLDLPGAGRTETTAASPIELRAHAVTLRQAIDALGLSRYALVGHDSGGFVARLVAAEDDRVAGLVLGNTEIPGHTPPLLLALMLTARVGLGPIAVRMLLGSGALRRSALGFGGCFEDPRYVDGEFHDLFLKPLLDAPQALAGALALLETANHQTMSGLDDAHRRIKAPTQLVWGEDDPWFPLARARGMVSQFGGGATLVTIPRGKLFVHEDHAGAFAQHARAFLAGCLPTREND